MKLQLQIVGALLILLALMHIAFPKRFGWKEELSSLSLLSRQIMYVHTFFIALVVFLTGVLSLFFADLLLTEELGVIICLGLSLFWLLRLFFQLFVYSKKLWKGKRFETTVHIIFTGLWAYFALVYYLAAELQLFG